MKPSSKSVGRNRSFEIRPPIGWSFRRLLPSRRWSSLLILCLGSLACLALFSLSTSRGLGTKIGFQGGQVDCGRSSLAVVHSNPMLPLLDPPLYLNGRPTQSFKGKEAPFQFRSTAPTFVSDNLRPEVQYITSWPDGGWTNQVMSTMNLIYLGLITDRVIVLPNYTPTHIGFHHRTLRFGEVFDIPRLQRALGPRKQILEWHEIKDSNSSVIDDLGCWSVWQTVQTFEKQPRGGDVIASLNLDVSYTQVPKMVKMNDNVNDRHSTFWALASLGFSSTRAASLVPPFPSSKHNISLPPDEHMLCYDTLYSVAAHKPFELLIADYSPAWRRVGQHMRWTAALEQLGEEYIRRTLGVREVEPIPPFLSVHVRHGDFTTWCIAGFSPGECFAPLSAYARRVREVQEELLERKGTEVKHVIVTSDETNSTWWKEVAAMGWRTPDHSQTQKGWYPVLIDAVIQSKATGYVGTARSTMSLLAGRRAETWNGAVLRYTEWGKPGADDH
ncbi:hypothetical protein B0H11DRAFT_2084608 [Mycena galericulata]|nr:hypothetical protein B0H11DRAFT_2084608 [Mycena galericulata]